MDTQYHLRSQRTEHSLQHEKDFRAAVEAINKAVKRAVESPKQYNRAAVLALHWENDDLGLTSIEQDLLQCFHDKFNFTVSSFTIPSASPYDAKAQTMTAVNTFVKKNDGNNSLLIFLYGGHGELAPQSELEIFGSISPGAVSIPWNFLENIVVARGDVLFILDACFSAGAEFPSQQTSLKNSEAEYLAASGFEQMASGSLLNSLTNRLINALKNMPQASFTVAQLHSYLVQQAQDPQNELEYTPVHIAHSSKPSITIRPLIQTPREVRNLHTDLDLSTGKVLISARLKDDASIPRIKEWEKWLAKGIPTDIGEISIEAVFKSHSTLCLFTMPTYVWNLLKHDPAYDFVASVKSHNMKISQGVSADIFNEGPVLGSRHGNVQIARREKKFSGSGREIMAD